MRIAESLMLVEQTDSPVWVTVDVKKIEGTFR